MYASLLSTALKIPRETGRRKIAKLVNKGLLKLSNRGQVVLSAVKGSTSQTFVENLLPRAKLILTADHEEAVKLVLEDRVQACIADLHICLMYSLLHPDSQLVTTEKPLTYEPLGIAPAGDDPLLTNWVENFLRLMQGAGEFEKMMGKWLKENVWIGELPPEAVRF